MCWKVRDRSRNYVTITTGIPIESGLPLARVATYTTRNSNPPPLPFRSLHYLNVGNPSLPCKMSPGEHRRPYVTVSVVALANNVNGELTRDEVSHGALPCDSMLL